ncbi:hypothetical protein Clacol_001569 [Clathrus columnatus]|uniref:CWF21 domain-containing protein n=1 Tax=Clathrus columnatus TaxID=1419009 RepID=A0AAV4ZYJ2_9AGAM|nr:hypothetical protein Clacol_001569 [Clathrus columnatus]
MYNGIGLTTPRGSGTSGYVVRNLSHLRHHETAAERAAALLVQPPRHREPDAAILEHERKRKIEIRCYELQVELEDKGMSEDVIREEVDTLRKRLVENMSILDSSAKNLKLTDTHGRAAAKKVEIDKMARALGTRSDYTEGEAFDREKQEELKQQRAIERVERDRRREEEREKREREKEKWEAIRKEKERLRRRQEDQARKAAEANRERGRDLGPRRREPSLSRPTFRRSPSRTSRGGRSPSPDRSRSPVRRRSRSNNRRIRSPPVRRGTRSPPPPKGRRSRTPDSRGGMRRSRSPGGPRNYGQGNSYRRRLSPPPPRSFSRGRGRSATPPPPSRRLSSRSPPHRHVSPPLDSPRHRQQSPERRITPSRGAGFGEKVIDDRSPGDRSPRKTFSKAYSRSPSPRLSRRSASESNSGSEMSVSGSED